ncbi:MAG: putative polynucleotide kinase [uncultured marine phage]|uniref:Putative polynucleotide kinase n=1 Tax=uncultured marine phage TaxID=707152 RepID=A0A8D9CC46_9VIRU|nr:MAG: putative polynucleotide kinase [uncultured marine phage]
MKYLKKFESFDNLESLNEARVVGFNNPNEGNFVVIAGGPGAGKSFVTGNLLGLRDFKLVNVDTFREAMAKKLGLDLGDPDDNMKILQMTHTTSDPRNRTVRHLKQFLSIPKDRKPNIVFDAGGGQTEVMKTVHELAKNIGYETTLVFVKTDLDTALDRNRQRERTLADEMVVDYHNLVQQSIDVLKNVFDNVWEVDNSEMWDHTDRPTDRIEKTK